MLRKTITAVAATIALSGTACAGDKTTMAPPAGDYRKVSELVALPDFIPGLGTLYIQPATLPAGPFLAYDRDGKLVSTIYMVPLKDIEDHKKISGLSVGTGEAEQVDMYYNAGHPGVEAPHYHVQLWHVPPQDAKLK